MFIYIFIYFFQLFGQYPIFSPGQKIIEFETAVTVFELIQFLYNLLHQDGRGGCKPKPDVAHDYVSKNRLRLQNSRKLECPAIIQIRAVKVFVDYHVEKDKCATNNSLTMAKKGVLKSLDKRLNAQTDSEPLRTMTRFYVRIPLCSLHVNHPVGDSATIGQCVDKRIVDKIYELVKRNITNVAEVKRCLDRYVENEVFADVLDAKKPKKTNRRYYPCRKDLRNHIARAISAQKYCDDDQESLRHKISDWQEKSPETNL